MEYDAVDGELGQLFPGRVVELVYTYALGAYAVMHESSSLSSPTKFFRYVCIREIASSFTAVLRTVKRR